MSLVLNLLLGLGLVFGGMSCDHDRVAIRLSRRRVLGDSLVLSANVGNGVVG